MKKGEVTVLGFGLNNLIWGIAIGLIVLGFLLAVYSNLWGPGGWHPEYILG